MARKADVADRDLSTRLIHPGHGRSDGDPKAFAAEEGASAHAGVSPLLDRSTTFRLDVEAERALALREGHDRFDVYGRFGTRTTRDAAALVAELEGAPAALLFASGMGAIAATLFALTSPGDRVAVASDVYGGTEGLVQGELRARGVELVRFDAADPRSLEAALETTADDAPLSVIWVESISNPLLKVAAVSELAAMAQARGAKLVVDATFAAGIAQRPLAHGAHVVVHSATKFLNGHSDVIAGAVASDAATVDRIFRTMTHLGSCIDPSGAWLLARGMRTLPMRYAKQCSTADALARRLDAHDAVQRVFHPSLPTHTTHALGLRELKHGGAVLSFELRDGDGAMRVGRAMRLCAFAVSLGGIETLIAIPRRSSHVGLTPEHWDALGIREGLVRVAVGLEDVEDLWADFEQALSRA